MSKGQVTGIEDFDWGGLGKHDEAYTAEQKIELEAAYGKKYREAVENSLSRMKKGSNRVAGGNRLSNQVLDYINNSTGVTMFINARSALFLSLSLDMILI